MLVYKIKLEKETTVKRLSAYLDEREEAKTIYY